nr:DNA polymerase IV [Chitinophagales bacterium]MBP9222075.1 DNA polymerase IV [Chitinophagales bacterium]
DIIADRVPVLEKASIDEFYIDLSGMDTFFGSFKLAKELRELIKNETGLPISFGLSTNKTVAKIATGEAKPDGFLFIEAGKEKEFLSKLHITKIPGVGDKTYPKLKAMGVEMVKDIQDFDIIKLQEEFGEMGIALWNKANGIDNNPVVPYTDRKSISSENTFEQDITDAEYLETYVISLVEQLSFKLRKENFLTSCVAIKMRYSNFETFIQQSSLTATASDNILIPKTKELLHKMFDTKRAVRLIGVRFSNLMHGQQQIDMFNDTEENINLYKALDAINKKYGNKTVHRAKTINTGDRAFNPFNGKPNE